MLERARFQEPFDHFIATRRNMRCQIGLKSTKSNAYVYIAFGLRLVHVLCHHLDTSTCLVSAFPRIALTPYKFDCRTAKAADMTVSPEQSPLAWGASFHPFGLPSHTHGSNFGPGAFPGGFTAQLIARGLTSPFANPETRHVADDNTREQDTNHPDYPAVQNPENLQTSRKHHSAQKSLNPENREGLGAWSKPPSLSFNLGPGSPPVVTKSNAPLARTLEAQFDGEDSPLALVRKSPNFTGLLTAVESPVNERETKRAKVEPMSPGRDEADREKDAGLPLTSEMGGEMVGRNWGGDRDGATFNLMGAAISPSPEKVRFILSQRPSKVV